MKTLYIQCSMGAAGDMLMAALFELLSAEQQKAFLRKINSLGIPGVSVAAEPSVRGGIRGTHMRVEINGEEEGSGHHHDHHQHSHNHNGSHGHNGPAEIRSIIEKMDVSEGVKRDALAVYNLIGQAESQVHGQPMEHIHFHEVGSLDAVTDVVGNCLLMEMIGADTIAVSPVHVGSGTVKCAHGILPVPAPATALLLRGIPSYSGDVRGELCTPTGAALLKHFGQSFGPMPAMTLEKTGYGMGTKDFPQAANCVRVLLGETAGEAAAAGRPDVHPASVFQAAPDHRRDQVYELCCNLDDITGEEIGFAMEQLLDAGALDVWTEAITMKKNRPAVKLCVLVRGKDRQHMAETIFKHTTTIGIRQQVWSRYVLARCEQKQETALGEVNVKFVSGWGTVRGKYEYGDLARIAREKNMSLRQVKEALGPAGLKKQD